MTSPRSVPRSGDVQGARQLADACGRAAEDAGGRLRSAYLMGLAHLLTGRPMAAGHTADLAPAQAAGATAPGTVMCRLARVLALTGQGFLDRAREEAESLRAECAALGEWGPAPTPTTSWRSSHCSRTVPRTRSRTPGRCWRASAISVTASAWHSAWTCWRRHSPPRAPPSPRRRPTRSARPCGVRSATPNAEHRSWALCASTTRAPSARRSATSGTRPCCCRARAADRTRYWPNFWGPPPRSGRPSPLTPTRRERKGGRQVVHPLPRYHSRLGSPA